MPRGPIHTILVTRDLPPEATYFIERLYVKTFFSEGRVKVDPA